MAKEGGIASTLVAREPRPQLEWRQRKSEQLTAGTLRARTTRSSRDPTRPPHLRLGTKSTAMTLKATSGHKDCVAGGVR